MIGRIEFDGGDRCKDCPIADLRVETLYSSSNRIPIHIVTCEHEAACNRTEYITIFNNKKEDE